MSEMTDGSIMVLPTEQNSTSNKIILEVNESFKDILDFYGLVKEKALTRIFDVELLIFTKVGLNKRKRQHEKLKEKLDSINYKDMDENFSSIISKGITNAETLLKEIEETGKKFTELVLLEGVLEKLNKKQVETIST